MKRKSDTAFGPLSVFMLLAVWLLAGDFAAAGVIKPLNNNRRSVVVQVFDAASEAVVNISTTKVQSVRGGFWGDSMFDDVFRFNMPGGSPFRRQMNVTSLGSGFVIHPDGYILTNEHVVQRATQITVTLADGCEHPASVVSTDYSRDLAMLKIELPQGVTLAALPLGRSDDLMIGESVIAIGNPKGYKNSVTSGLVSATGRTLEFGNNVQYTNLIQTDAAINPGNSGGPLLNVNAEVIGVNSAMRADAQNIGFSIAIDDVVRDMPRLLDLRRINRLDLGFEPMVIGQPNDKLQLCVTKVRPYGPADKGGLKDGMIISAIDGEALNSPADFFIAMLSVKVGGEIKLSTAEGDCKLEVVQIPEPDGAQLAMKLLGLQLREITPEMTKRYRLSASRGLYVTGILDGSPADNIGMKAGDIIFQLGRSYVISMDQVGRMLEGVRAGDTIRIGVARGNMRVQTSITAADVDVLLP